MGRIGRQRTYKQVDPNKIVVKKKSDGKQSSFDLDPSKDKSVRHELPKKMRRMVAISKVAARKNMKQKDITTKKKMKKPGNNADLKIKEGESQKQFFARLDNKVKTAMDNVIMETKTIRGKRKSHLQKRDEKRKSKKRGIETSTDEKVQPVLYEDVKFGDIVTAPPVISAIPRKASLKKVQNSGMKLAKVLEPENGNKTLSGNDEFKLRRKDMSESNKMVFDKDRSKVIEEYRKIKFRKNHPRLPKS